MVGSKDLESHNNIGKFQQMYFSFLECCLIMLMIS